MSSSAFIPGSAVRISFILPTPNMSGGIRVVAIYASWLARQGHDVVLVSQPAARLPLRRKFKSLLSGRGWPQTTRPHSHLDDLALEHRMLERRRQPTDRDVPDADVVIATWWETAAWVNALSPAKGAKVYFVQGHEIFPHLPVLRVEESYRLPLRKIVVARWLQDVMRERYGDPTALVVPNAVDHGQFHAPSRGRQKRPTVGFLYSEMPLKALDVVWKVLAELCGKYPDLRIIGFGSSPPLTSLPADLPIELTVAPAQNEIRNIYAQCDAWLSASRSEGFNLTVMEAMACRTPAVATRTGWPAEALVNGWNGMLTEVDDIPGLVSGVESVLALTDEAWRAMSDHALQTVASSSWDVSALMFERALHFCRDNGAREV